MLPAERVAGGAFVDLGGSSLVYGIDPNAAVEEFVAFSKLVHGEHCSINMMDPTSPVFSGPAGPAIPFLAWTDEFTPPFRVVTRGGLLGE
jgi:hypothetical protein